MESAIQDLFIGAASSGLWSIVAVAGTTAIRALKEQLSKNDVITQAVETAVASVEAAYNLGTPPERSRLVQFLQSPELESIIRQLYANHLIGKNETEVGTDSIRREFLELFALHLDVSTDRIQGAADPLFNALVAACNNILTRTVGQAGLGAHEALSQYRTRRLLDELAVVERNLAVLINDTKPDIRSFLAFEETYRAQVGVRHSHIQPPHFDTARKVPIDDLFVTPAFVSPSRRKRVLLRKEQLGIDVVLESLYRLVIVGNPGGGKSTLAIKLVHDMVTHYAQRPVCHRQLTPILVILREYGRIKKSMNCSILQFIEMQANTMYQVRAPAGAFEYLLLNGRVLVIFDGLDEMLDTSHRQEISGDVESFCSLYPAVPVLVTSREVGYDQAPLDDKKFRLLVIAPFDEGRVSEYSEKWFALDEECPEEEQQKTKARAFVSESQVAPDVRSNPLMLGLMCNLYKVEGYIPRNRADVYEKCSIMLFERWDRGRGIVVGLPFEAHVRPAMQHLAHWIYSDESLQAGVTQDKLVAETTRYLLKWVFDDSAEANSAAEEFVAFCTGRAWVFTDTGTTAEGDKLYQFTHRTFLEYFTSSYLVSLHPTPAALLEILHPRIKKEEWDVVATLAFQIQSRRVQGAADVLLTGLLSGWASMTEQASCIAFAGRCLESIVPSPKVRRAIATQAVDFAVVCGGHGRSTEEIDLPRRRRSRALMVLRPLAAASLENRSTIAEVFRDRISTWILASSDEESLAAFEILLHPSHFVPYRLAGGSAFQFWRSLVEDVISASRARLRELARIHVAFCVDAVLSGTLTVEDLLDWHGAGALFVKRPFRCSPGTGTDYFTSMVVPLVAGAIGDLPDEDFERLEAKMSLLGRLLGARRTPWIEQADPVVSSDYGSIWDYGLFEAEERDSAVPKSFGPEALFGAFCLFGLASELSFERVFNTNRPIFKSLRGSNLVLIIRIASARSRPLKTTKLANFTKRCGFDEGQSAFIRRWSDGEISLTSLRIGVQPGLFGQIPLDADEIDEEDIEGGSSDLGSQ